MYKGFFEDVEYVMGLFFKPFEGCCEDDDSEDDEAERECSMGCDCMPCSKEACKGDEDADDEEGKGCDLMPCFKDDEEDNAEDNEEDNNSPGGFLGPGPLTDVLKCMFDASDTDYDYED